MQELNELKATITSELARISADLDTKAVQAQAQVKNLGDETAELKTSIDKLLLEQTKWNTLEARLAAVEQEGDLKPGASGRGATVGQQVAAFDGLKAWSPSSSRDTLRIPVRNALFSSDVGGTDGTIIAPSREAGVVPMLRQRLFVRDLIPAGRIESNVAFWVQQTGFTNNAAVVSEGIEKPESTIAFTLKQTPVTTIAHYFKAAKQLLDDMPALQSTVDDELRYGLKYAEEQEILFGDGLGVSLLGICPQATAFSQSLVVSNRTMIDDIRDAMLQAQLARLPASGIVMHFTDWAQIETLKDSTYRYVIGNPQGSISPTLWGLPVVTTEISTFLNKFLTGGFQGGAMILDREDANVVIATENEDDFIKNMITIRCEERLALQVKRPEAFIYGNFQTGT